MTLDEQIEAMLQALPRRHRIPFLAGARFVMFHAEHGDSLFRKTEAELSVDERDELVDRYTYRQRRRWLRKQRS